MHTHVLSTLFKFVLFLLCSWYHPNADRHVAESLLMQNGQDGCYLLRPSSRPGELALSVRWGLFVGMTSASLWGVLWVDCIIVAFYCMYGQSLWHAPISLLYFPVWYWIMDSQSPMYSVLVSSLNNQTLIDPEGIVSSWLSLSFYVPLQFLHFTWQNGCSYQLGVIFCWDCLMNFCPSKMSV